MYQDVSSREQTIEVGLQVWSRQIDSDSALIGIEVKKETAFFGIRLFAGGKRAPPAKDIARRFLDFDYVGAEIGHQLGGERGGNSFATFDYP